MTLFFRSFVYMAVPVQSMTVLDRGGVASSKHRANNVEGNEATVWPLIGTQSSGGVWLAAGRGRLKKNSSTQRLFAESVLFRLQLCVSSDLAHLAWPGVCPLSSSHRVGVGALCERLPVCGQSLLWRGRGERHPPSPPSQCSQGAYRNVRGGWPWQPTSPVQWSQEAQVGHAPDMMSCLFTVLNDGKERSRNVMLSALQTIYLAWLLTQLAAGISNITLWAT